MSENALQKIEPMPMAAVEPTTPHALMRRATDVAGVCREIVLKTACEIQGRKFVKVEGWESIATAHGCFVGAEDAKRAYDKEGNHIGYEARSVMRNSHGDIIATGEGFVGFDEKDRKGNATWKNRAEYAGRAMAQTRSISRVCRSVFAHVVVLIDAGLSTTPAEEVPEGGFDDNERATRAKPAKVPHGTCTPTQKPTKPVQATEPATEDQRVRWVKQLKTIEAKAEAYGYANGILLPPSGPDSDQTPGEPVECWPLSHTPSTKAQAERMFAEIQAFGGAESPPGEPEGGFDGASDQNTSNQAVEPQEAGLDENGEPVLEITGKLEQVAIKEGTNKKGKWKRYGVRIGKDWWANTFSATIGRLAEADKGKTVRVLYREGERGNDLVGIEPV